MLGDLVLAPEEDGYVEVVYPRLLGVGQPEFVEAEQPAHLRPAPEPPVDGLANLLSGVADPVHQRAAAHELVQVLYGRDERWGRGGGGARRRQRPPGARRRGRRAVIRACEESFS